MLDANIKAQLKSHLDKVVQPVALIVYQDSSELSEKLYAFAQEVAELSPSLTLTTEPLDKGKARLALKNDQGREPIAFAGVPMGHEFTSFVLALLLVGGHPINIKAEDEALIQTIDTPKIIETWVSLSCQNCPDVVQMINQLAILNPQIQHVMVDGAHFKEEAQKQNVLAVPAVFSNNDRVSSGRIELTDFLEKLGVSTTVDLSRKGLMDVLVVGGGPAGASAAIYAARKGLKTAVIADRFGGQVQDTVAIENFISVSHTEGQQLARNLEAHVTEYDVDIIKGQVADIEKNQHFTVTLNDGQQLQAKTVIVSTGARWREMGVEGEDQYKGRGVAFCPHCDGPLFKNKRVAVVGGGNSGIEAAIDLAGIAKEVTVLEFADTLKADAVLQAKAAATPNITIHTSVQTTSVYGEGAKLQGLTYKNRNTEEETDLALDGVFVQIGLMPNSEWIKDRVDVNHRGEIIVDYRAETSVSGLFAAGDVTDSAYKQIIIAMGQGATASLSAFDYLIRHDADAVTEKAAA
ncbi:MAG: alkyl hydroperoxide reductase subunit F [Cellvibrionales bacterium]|nr:alkyl hydroperoxide reductase subunit F [Cellvibrionales bacterium]